MKTLAYIIIISFGSLVNVLGQTEQINKGYEKGLMDGIYKIGLWQYYDSAGMLELEVDYDQGVLTYLEIDTSDFVIFKDGEWVTSKVDIPPRHIGSSVEFYNILNDHVNYPAQARYRDVVGKVYVVFDVDTTGRATNYRAVNDIGCECAYEFERVLKLIPNYWLVAENDGKKYKSRFIISCEFGIILDGKRLKERKRRSRKKQKDTVDFPLAREMKGISYVIKKGYNPE